MSAMKFIGISSPFCGLRVVALGLSVRNFAVTARPEGLGFALVDFFAFEAAFTGFFDAGFFFVAFFVMIFSLIVYRYSVPSLEGTL
jgi:hypothetical protein